MLYNWKIIGHEKQLNRLECDLKNDSLSHAYLLCGPEQIGKSSVAKTLSFILQCPNHFCQDCDTCRQISKNIHADTIIWPDDGERLKIDKVRELIARLNMSTQSKYKVVLIENIERFTNEAANCFLKTLEEPAIKVIFLLTSSNLSNVLSTIISRVRLIKFHSFSDEELKTQLKSSFPDRDDETLSLCVSFALGKTGKAMQLLKSDELLHYYQELYVNIQSFFDGERISKKFSFVEELVKEGKEIDVFLDLLSFVVRKKLLKQSYSDVETNICYSSDDLINLLKKIEETRMHLKFNVNAKLALESLILTI